MLFQRIFFKGLCLTSVFTIASGAVSTTRAQLPPQAQWTLRYSASGPFNDIVFADQFVAVGAGGLVAISTNGSAWTAVPSGVTMLLTAVAAGGGKFVAVGDGGTVVTSPDGQAWTPQSSGITYNLTGVTYGNGQFVACGSLPTGGVGSNLYDQGIWVSTNGASWTRVFTGQGTAMEDVAFGGAFVVIASGRTPQTPFTSTTTSILRSSNGVEWTVAALSPIPKPPTATGNDFILRSIAFSGGRFLATGGYAGGILIHSTDGLQWSPGFVSDQGEVGQAAFGSGIYLAVGYGGMPMPTPSTFWSTDAISWNTQTHTSGPFPLPDEYGAATFGNRTFVLATVQGRIYQSDILSGLFAFDLAQTSYLPNEGFRTAISIPLGKTVAVEYSENCVNWRVLQELTSSGPIFDRSATGQISRFYRARTVD